MKSEKHGFWWWFQAILPGWQIVFFLREHFRFEREMKKRQLRHEARMKEVERRSRLLTIGRTVARLTGNQAGAIEYDRALAALCLSLLENVENE